MKEQKKFDLEILAGPCSWGPENLGEIYKIADTEGVSGTRIVGLKSRSSFNKTGEGIGTDFEIVNRAIEHGINLSEMPPSVIFARDFVKETGMVVATEVMLPDLQLPFYEEAQIPPGKLLIWNPAVDQLGWHIRQNASYAQRNNWRLGIKNGKALGATLKDADNPATKSTPLEDTWAGLASYAGGVEEVVLIHRGVDIPEKGKHRNALVHEAAKRTKRRVPGSKLFFDPSHSFGPKMRDEIVNRTFEIMKMKTDREEFLYDGILIETGTSKTDTNQHITIDELRELVDRLSDFRKLRTPEKVVFESSSVIGNSQQH